jgi:hypothetical protein
MKFSPKALLILILVTSFNFIKAQSINIDLLNLNDTLWFKMNNPAIEELLNTVKFNYTKGKDKFDIGQVVMKVHNLDPFKLPQFLLNNKPVNIGLFLPNLDQDASFNYTMYDSSVLYFRTPFGRDAAEISFIFNTKDLIQGENEIRIRTKDILKTPFIITNIKLALRGRSINDIVEYPAEFIGGMKGWVRYLEINLDSNVPIRNGAPNGIYSVTVSFTVLDDGSLSDIIAENDPGYGTKEEAIRILKNSPKWKAAVRNGNIVSYRHRQAIVFGVKDFR